MSDSRPSKPRHMSWIVPYLTVSDVFKMLDFYREAFGFTSNEPPLVDETGKAVHGMMNHQTGVIMLGIARGQMTPQPTDDPQTCNPLELYVYCEDVDALCDIARGAGATVLGGPEDMFWGDRVVRLADPDGHRWTFATNTGGVDLPDGLRPATGPG